MALLRQQRLVPGLEELRVPVRVKREEDSSVIHTSGMEELPR